MSTFVCWFAFGAQQETEMCRIIEAELRRKKKEEFRPKRYVVLFGQQTRSY